MGRWYIRAAHRRDCIRRTRRCEMCGFIQNTVEFTALCPRPQSTPDRCPKCIIGKGKVERTKYATDRFPHKDAKVCGAIARHRKCIECKKEWYTYETLPGAKRDRDISRCCGRRMRVLGG